MSPGAGPRHHSMTTGKIDPRYGNPSASTPGWEEIAGLLTDAQLYWIITVRADGRPHAVPLVGVWHDGAFAFCTGGEEQKQRNLDVNPHVNRLTAFVERKGVGGIGNQRLRGDVKDAGKNIGNAAGNLVLHVLGLAALEVGFVA